MANPKKLNDEARMRLQACLAKGYCIKAISKEMGYSVATVYRELERASYVKNPGNPACDRLAGSKAAVCNYCPKRGFCTREKRFYDWRLAADLASETRSASRSGTRLGDGDVRRLDAYSRQLIDTGSVHHVYASNPEISAICCERTFRRLICSGRLSCKPHQLRRYVRFKRRPPKPPRSSIAAKDPAKMLGRLHSDFVRYTGEHRKAEVVQFDSVVGKAADKKAILTIAFPRFDLQIGRVVAKGSPSSAMKAIGEVMGAVFAAGYEDAFEACISDNGSEFATFYEIESLGRPGKVHAFYARPMRSDDKADCERNHEMVRYKFPKGKSLDGVTREMVAEAFDNVNSLVREGKGDRTPYELAERALGKAFLDALGLKKVDRRKVNLKPLI